MVINSQLDTQRRKLITDIIKNDGDLSALLCCINLSLNEYCDFASCMITFSNTVNITPRHCDRRNEIKWRYVLLFDFH